MVTKDDFLGDEILFSFAVIWPKTAKCLACLPLMMISLSRSAEDDFKAWRLIGNHYVLVRGIVSI